MDTINYSRIKYLLQSIVAVYFRPLFDFIYQLKKSSPKVIGQIYYEAHLFKEVNRVINSDLIKLFISPQKLPPQFGIGLSERIIELPWFLAQVSQSSGSLLDAGSSLNYQDVLFHQKLHNKKIAIVNLNPERNCYWRSSISYLYTDLRQSIYTDEYFDTIACISVLEHIGLENERWTGKATDNENNPSDYLLVVKELKRILKKQGECFITLPVGKYQNLKWLQIFNEAMVKKIITTFDPKSYALSYYQYTKEGWQLSTARQCYQCGFSHEYPGHDFHYGPYAVCCLKLVKK